MSNKPGMFSKRLRALADAYFYILSDKWGVSDIVDVIGKDVKLEKSGGNYIGCCPFHESKSNSSFVVFPESNTWRCFGECNEGGDLVQYVMKRDGITAIEAIKKLAG